MPSDPETRVADVTTAAASRRARKSVRPRRLSGPVPYCQRMPMTPEALLLSALDDLEAKMQNMRAEFGKELAAGKSGAGMTEWVRSMERPLLNSQAFLAEEEGSF